MKKNFLVWMLTVAGISLICSGFAVNKAFCEEGIISEGIAVIQGDDIARVREAAISDALGLALEQRLGTELETEREVKNYSLISSRIRSKARGTIESYNILDEKKFTYTYWVKLRVMFKKDVIKKEGLDTIQVIVVADEQLAKGIITEKLVNSGLKVIEPTAVQLWDLWGGKVAAKAAMMETLNADLIVLAKTKTRLADKFGELYVCKANAEVKVIKPYTAEIVAVTRISSVWGERKLEQDEAAESAITACSRKIGDYVLDNIVQKSKSIISCRVVVTGIKNRWQVDQIVRALSQKDGIKQIRSRMVAKKVATLDVDLAPMAKEKMPYYLEHLGPIDLRVVREFPGWLEVKKY